MRRTSPTPDGACVERRKHNDRQSLFLGLALLLTLMCEVTPMGSGGALSTTITGSRDPTALQQLATFAALRDEADEQNLDWGSFSSLSQKERGYKPPTTPTSQTPGAVSSTESEHGESYASSHTGETHSSSSTISRRRPHRRHRRGQKLGTGSAMDDSETDAGLSSMATSSSVHTRRFWSQLHVMEVAYSTHDNNFIQITERFAEYERMYPIVYQCHVANVHCPAEADLLAAPQLGLDTSRFWTCDHCGKAHDAVREQCLRCRHASHFTKLFVGQAVKEANCAQSLIRLLHASHPHVDIHRIECHQRGDGSGTMSATERYKGCASVYVSRDQAQELVDFLNHNVFFDETSDGALIAHYVYGEQQGWLRALAAARSAAVAMPSAPSPMAMAEATDTASDAGSSLTSAPSSAFLPLQLAGGPRAVYLPWAPLVVELSVSETRPAKRGGGGGSGGVAVSRAQAATTAPMTVTHVGAY